MAVGRPVGGHCAAMGRRWRPQGSLQTECRLEGRVRGVEDDSGAWAPSGEKWAWAGFVSCPVGIRTVPTFRSTAREGTLHLTGLVFSSSAILITQAVSMGRWPVLPSLAECGKPPESAS